MAKNNPNKRAALAAQRAAIDLDTSIPQALPIAGKADEILASIEAHPVTVVCGATGSGKTTQLPKLCLRAGLGVAGAIGHTQPRRLAARSVAQRIADETGAALGDAVGYRVRFADRTSPLCRIKLMTDGIALQELRHDRALRAYDCVIVDEAHERSLNIDFLLGCLKGLLHRRDDLKLVVTSATIDPQRFADFFGGAPIIEVGGRGYPIDLRYAPAEETELVGAVTETVRALLGEHGQGGDDILVFLPGERAIGDCARALRRAGVASEADVLELFARLPAKRQHAIFAPGARRRVILATNVAETSLTVPRIGFVVDSGLARIGRYSHRSKLQRLPIEPIARANADQRAGRCGRLGPGVCVRLYAEDDYAARPAFEAPQVQRSNLAGVILQMSALGLGRVERFDFMDPPDPRLVRDGYNVLRELNAIDADDALTDLGLRMARLPLAPRLSRALLAAADLGCLDEALAVVSGLSVPDPLERGASRDDEARPSFVEPRSDWTTLLNLWREFAALKGEAARRKFCARGGVSRPRMDEWQDVHRQLRRLCRDVHLTPNRRPADYASLHRALLFGFVSHLGQRDEGNLYRGARGRRFSIFPGSSVAPRPPPWIVATELIETSRVFGHRVAGVKPAWIAQAAEHLLRREYLEPAWSGARGQATVREQVSVFGLVLGSRRRVPLAPVDPEGARRLLIDHLLVAPGEPLDRPFARRNAELRERAAGWEARLRRLLVDDATLAGFFAARIPANLTRRREFLRWYDEGVRADPDILQLSPADLGLKSVPSAAWFPTHMHVAGNKLELAYRFAPGQDDDGVTLRLPLALAGHVSAAQLSWVVPGWLEEKSQVLLRSLPKRERRKLTPAADAARRFVAFAVDADLPGGSESLEAALARFVRDAYGVTASAAAFAGAELPAHLRLRIALLDADGEIIASGRDVEALRRRHTASDAPPPATGEWQRDGLTRWDFERLPEAAEVEEGALRIAGCPALVETNGGVALRLFPDLESALRRHGDGVVRLAMVELADKIRYLRRNLPDASRLSLLYLQLGDFDELLDDLVFAALRDGAPGEGAASIRDAHAFREFVDDARRTLIEGTQERAAVCLEILTLRQGLATALASAPPAPQEAADDLRSQLEHLVPPRFVRDTPGPWLGHLPRFLNAMMRRLERLSARGGENAEHRELVARVWRRYLAVDDPERRERLNHYRWLVEELRVSLFAQPMKTSCPVSAKRIEAAWRAASQ